MDTPKMLLQSGQCLELYPPLPFIVEHLTAEVVHSTSLDTLPVADITNRS